MARTSIASLLVIFLFLVPADIQARTWHVTIDGAGDAPTIQAAIDSAGMDDTLLVGPGTYTWSNQETGNDYGMIHMMRGAPRLVIASEMGADDAILDGEEMGRIFFYQGYTGTMGGLTIDGFTFVRGRAPQSDYMVGGAFTAHLSSPILKHCIFRENTSDRGGACWFGGQGSPQFIDCVFENNTAIYGGGVILNDCYPSSISRSTFYFNESSSGGGISLLGTSTVVVDRTIVAKSIYGGAAAVPGSALLTLSCSDIFGNVGGDWTGPIADQYGVNGNFSEDPLFCSEPRFDLFLRADSPCAPGNHP